VLALPESTAPQLSRSWPTCGTSRYIPSNVALGSNHLYFDSPYHSISFMNPLKRTDLSDYGTYLSHFTRARACVEFVHILVATFVGVDQ